jgi:hypothetical protein
MGIKNKIFETAEMITLKIYTEKHRQRDCAVSKKQKNV